MNVDVSFWDIVILILYPTLIVICKKKMTVRTENGFEEYKLSFWYILYSILVGTLIVLLFGAYLTFLCTKEGRG